MTNDTAVKVNAWTAYYTYRQTLFSEEDEFLWLWTQHLTAESESEITATQETKHYATQILETGTVSKCRLCKKKYDETLHHFISARPILVKEQYVM